MKYISLFFIIIILQLNTYSQSQAPDFTVHDVYGNELSLYGDFLDQGKYVFIEFFNTGCQPCQELTPKVDTVFRDFGCNYGEIIFLGIEVYDYDADVLRFMNEFGMRFPGISGNEGGGNVVFNDFGYTYTPYKIVIDPDYNIITDNLLINKAEDLKDSLLNIGLSQQICEGNDFLFYSAISKNDSVVGEIDHLNKTIDVVFTENANLSDVVSTFFNEANSNVYINGTLQISGVTKIDLSEGPLVYEIISETGNSEFWTVTGTIAAETITLSDQIELFPNPSDGQFFLRLPSDTYNIQARISDINGKVIFSEKICKEELFVDIRNYNAGVYFLTLDFDSGIVSKKIFIN